MTSSTLQRVRRKSAAILASVGLLATSLATFTAVMVAQPASPASAAGLGGPVQLDGMDPVCHSGTSGASTEAYIAAVLKSLHDQASVSGNDGSIAILGAGTSNACGQNMDSTNPSNHVDVAYLAEFGSSKPSWTLYSDATAVNTFFTDLAAGTVHPKVIWMPDDWNRSSDVETAFSNNAEGIANFVNSGGGLFSNHGAYGWLSTLLPAAQYVNGGCNGGPELTTDGQNAFPTLTNSKVEACWHGSFWGSYTGLVSLVQWPFDALMTGATPTPMAAVAIGGSNVTMPSSFQLSTNPAQAIPSDTVDVIATAIGLDGTIYSGVNVSFSITSGPSAGWTASATTGSDGKAHASLTWTANGTDVITASATVNGSAKTQTYNLEWANDFIPVRFTDSVLGSMEVGVAYSNGILADGRPDPTYAITSGSLPAGLTLNSTTGAITGTPTTAGAFSFEVTATNSAGSATKTFSGSVATPAPVAPSWTDQTVADADQGAAYSDGVAASGSPAPTYSISSGALPAGLTLDTATGAITGAATATGTFNFQVTATNSQGSITKNLTIVVTNPVVAPSWTDQTLGSMSEGVAYSDGVEASGTPAPTYSVTTGSLPAGLSLDSSTGAITGTPTTAGAYSFEVTASNTGGDITKTFTGGVLGAPVWTDQTIADFQTWTSYSDGVAASGYPVPTYAVTSGALPAGVTLDASTGALSGMPTADGSYSFEITASNSEGDIAKTFSGTVWDAPAFTDSTVGTPRMNVPFSDGISATGTPAPTYSVTAGTLPAGLTLDPATGAITGTPTGSGAYSFEITATNAYGSVSLTFSGTATDTTPSFSDSNLSGFEKGKPFSYSVLATSSETVVYSISAGSLPAGLTLDPVTGTVSGTPTGSGSYSFTLRASAVGTSPESYTEVVFSGTILDSTPSFGSNPTYSGGTPKKGVPFQGQLQVTSSRPMQYRVASGTLPAGLSLDATTGALSGTPTEPGVFNFTIEAYTEFSSASHSFTMTVMPEDIAPVKDDVNAGSDPGSLDFSNLSPAVQVTVSPAKDTSAKETGTTSMSGNMVVFKPSAGFSGLAKVTVTFTVGSEVMTKEYTFTVNPAPAQGSEFRPAPATSGNAWNDSPFADASTVISWNPSENAVGYEVYLMSGVSTAGIRAMSSGKLLCSTSTMTSCSVSALLGPDSVIQVTAIGNDGLRSDSVISAYKAQTKPSSVMRAGFVADSWKLTTAGKADLAATAKALKAAGYKKVWIYGFTDSRGSKFHNNWLSKMRANAAKAYMAPRLPGVTIVVVGMGSSSPKASNKTATGRATNRRVEISVL